MHKIAPSLLAADFGRLGEATAAAQAAGADWLHLDVMDGHFVPNITIGPGVVRALRYYATIPFDVHLMIIEPDRHLASFGEAGADIITIHAEACVHLHRTIQSIRAMGIKAGVALNPHTPLEMVQYVLAEVDLVLLMSVNPGFGGQRFLPFIVTKIQKLRQMIETMGLQTLIQVDGGITVETAPAAVAAGADVLVAGTSVFGEADLAKAITALRNF